MIFPSLMPHLWVSVKEIISVYGQYFFFFVNTETVKLMKLGNIFKKIEFVIKKLFTLNIKEIVNVRKIVKLVVPATDNSGKFDGRCN